MHNPNWHFRVVARSAQSMSRTLVRLEDSLLRTVCVVKSFKRSAAEGEGPEGIYGDAEECRCPKYATESNAAHCEHCEKEDGVIVGKPITKLQPTAILVQEIHERDCQRTDREAPELSALLYWPQKPDI